MRDPGELAEEDVLPILEELPANVHIIGAHSFARSKIDNMKYLTTKDYIYGTSFGIAIFLCIYLCDFILGIIVASAITFSNNADAIHKFLLSAAVLIGGISAYIRFFYGQTYSSRIELKTTYEIVEIDKHDYFKIRVEAKNIGTTSFYFGDGNFNPKANSKWLKRLIVHFIRLRHRRQQGRAWKFRTLAGISLRRGYIGIPDSGFAVTEWHENVLDDDGKPYKVWQPIKLPLFQGHQWIRANETIIDEIFVGMSGPLPSIIQIQTEIISKAKPFNFNGDKWKTINTFHVPLKEPEPKDEEKKGPSKMSRASII